MSDRRQQPSKSTEYQVGYGKPPVETRFKQGQSGNAKGRPSKTFTSMDEIESKVLFGKRTVRIEGKSARMTTFEILCLKQIELAMKGDTKAFKEITARAARHHDRQSRIPLSVEEMSTKELLKLRDNILAKQRSKQRGDNDE